jgi:16S rRNA (cytosine1402-N4)-methyltransferase
VINEYSEEELANVLFQFGELRNSRSIAKTIVEARSNDSIQTSFELKEILRRYLPKSKEHKILAQIFQAIRIEVNEEIQVLKEFLLQTEALLDKGGRLSVISYHSLEDRLVKRFIRGGQFKGEAEKDFFGNVKVPFRRIGKLVQPTSDEIKRNNRARSAKLRIAERN